MCNQDPSLSNSCQHQLFERTMQESPEYNGVNVYFLNIMLFMRQCWSILQRAVQLVSSILQVVKLKNRVGMLFTWAHPVNGQGYSQEQIPVSCQLIQCLSQDGLLLQENASFVGST